MLFCNDPMFVSHLVTSAPFSTSDNDSLIFSLLIDLAIKSNVWSYYLSTLIFSLSTIIYRKLAGSMNLRCVGPLLLNHVITNLFPTKTSVVTLKGIVDL